VWEDGRGGKRNLELALTIPISHFIKARISYGKNIINQVQRKLIIWISVINSKVPNRTDKRFAQDLPKLNDRGEVNVQPHVIPTQDYVRELDPKQTFGSISVRGTTCGRWQNQTRGNETRVLSLQSSLPPKEAMVELPMGCHYGPGQFNSNMQDM